MCEFCENIKKYDEKYLWDYCLSDGISLMKNISNIL